MRAKEKTPSNLTLSAVKCECGFEIPIVGIAGKVGSVIDAHAEDHKRKNLNASDGENEAEQVRNDLIKKVFERVSQACI